MIGALGVGNWVSWPGSIWCSDAGQDYFAYQQCKQYARNGIDQTFIDVGSAWAQQSSNSFTLEQIGWRGLAIEIRPDFVAEWKAKRSSPLIISNALYVDWKPVLDSLNLGPVIDYLSVDLDDETEFIMLHQLFDAGFSFHAITIEHNRYSHGDFVRDAQRDLIQEYGYTLAYPDVKQSSGLEFEDWWTKA